MKKLLWLALLWPGLLFAADRHVSPAGSGTTCSHAAPCAATYGVQTAGIGAGDTVWLHPGRYDQFLCVTRSGSAGNPLVIRAEDKSQRTRIVWNNSAGASMCGSGAILGVSGGASYVRFQDIEVHIPGEGNPIRAQAVGNATPSTFKGNCVSPSGIGIEFINMILHDCIDGTSGGDGTAFGKKLFYGNIIYSIGHPAQDAPHGHALYIQNCDGSNEETCRSLFQDNVDVGSFSYDVQVYGTNSLTDISYVTLDHNLLFPAGNSISGNLWGLNFIQLELGSAGGVGSCTEPAHKMFAHEIVNGNYTYNGTSNYGAPFNIGYLKGSCEVQFTNNYLAGRYKGGVLNETGTFGPLTITGNTFFKLPPGSEDGGPVPPLTQANYPNNTFRLTWPTSGKDVFYRPNQFEPGRGYVVLYNFDHSATYDVNIDSLGGYSGLHWKLFNAVAPNYYEHTPVATGTCAATCGTVTVSTTAADTFRPYGSQADGVTLLAKYPDQGPEFVAWLLYPDYSAGVPSPTPTSTPTNTKTSTSSPTSTNTPTFTPSATNTATVTPSQSPTASRTPTATATATHTFTPSLTPTVTRTPTVGASSTIYIEPENCTVSPPMAIVNDASVFNGKYVSSPTQYQGQIVCSIPTLAATYKLWARVKSDTPSTSLGDSFTIDVDGDGAPQNCTVIANCCLKDGDSTCTRIFDVAESQTVLADEQGNPYCNDDPTHRDVWLWNTWNDRSATDGPCTGVGTRRLFTLTAATHTFTIRQRDPNAKLDRLILTTNMNFEPSDIALTPTPTPLPRICKVKCNHRTCYIRTTAPCNTTVPVPCPCR